jgi:thioredoxin-dependent peroxiredoxin
MKFIQAATLLAATLGVTLAFAGPEVSKSTIEIGEGKTVNLKGSPMPLGGTALKVGDTLPASMLTAGDMSGVNLGEKKGKVKIISVVPSVDTPVCEEQTHELSEKNGGIDKNVELYTVSMDLPFAQARFAKEAKIGNVTFLSDYKGADFGNKHGLLVKPINLLSRALIVTDKDNVVRYMQVVPELTTLPDMAEAVKAAKSLL